LSRVDIADLERLEQKGLLSEGMIPKVRSCVTALQNGVRLREVRVVRDYGMFDRREAPQYYPDAKGAPTVHS